MAVLLAVACDEPIRPTRTVAHSYAPIYFFDGDALSPEYRAVPDRNVVRALFDHLTTGPTGSTLRSAIPQELQLVGVGEIDEGIILELNDAFWNAPTKTQTEVASQLVYTLASLEEGKKLSLLRGTLPGGVPLPNGRSVSRPITRDDFRRYEPWIEVVQPVAGAVVSRAMPVQLNLRKPGQVIVTVFAGGQSLVKGGISGGDGFISIPESSDVEATVELMIRAGKELRVVEVPVRLAASG